MPKGKVKYFNEPRGWGIIAGPDSSTDVYFHYTAIDMEGYKTVKAGQEVKYDLAVTNNVGASAKNVQVII